MNERHSAPDSIRVLLVDDHPVFLEGLRATLSSARGFEVVGTAASAAEVPEQLSEGKPDVVLLDLLLPDRHGKDVARAIQEEAPGVRMLVVTVCGLEALLPVVRSGVLGFLPKTAAPETIVEAVRTVHAGEAYFSPEASRLLADGLTGEGRGDVAALTPREREVAELVAEDLRNKEIAERLDISVRTVETHRRRVMKKLGARTGAGLVRRLFECGVLWP